MKIKNCFKTPARVRGARGDAFTRHVRFWNGPPEGARNILAMFAEQPGLPHCGWVAWADTNALEIALKRLAEMLSKGFLSGLVSRLPFPSPSFLPGWTPLLPSSFSNSFQPPNPCSCSPHTPDPHPLKLPFLVYKLGTRRPAQVVERPFTVRWCCFLRCPATLLTPPPHSRAHGLVGGLCFKQIHFIINQIHTKRN